MFTDNRVCFGQENELRYSARDLRGQPVPPSVLISETARIAPSLPSAYSGYFLTCGRIYEDPSGHPEQCTSEVDTPLALVASREAGQAWLSRAVQRMKQCQMKVTLSRQNVDHLSEDPECSWACHTSFSTNSHSRKTAELLPPFLVSKCIIDGAGGISPWRTGMVRFSLAPRMELHTRVVGSNTQHQRALVCTRSDMGRPGLLGRQHFTCNECLCSHVAEYLRFGSMALALKLLDAGVLEKHPLRLMNPIAAIQTFTSDPTCTARVPLSRGGDISAIEIQRHYLELAEANARELFAPSWTADVCRLWRAMLDRIEAGAPYSVVGMLDWATRWELMSGYVHKHGGSWKGCEQQLYEIDVRFSEIGPEGFWEQMDADGVLNHRMVSKEKILETMMQPPDCNTRARARGTAVLELSPHEETRRNHLVTWDGVEDLRNGRRLVLKDPWDAEGVWKNVNELTDDQSGDVPF